MDYRKDALIIGLLAVLFFTTIAQATIETIVDNNIEWIAQHYATCSITSCYIDFTIKNKNPSLITYDPSELKAVASQIENSVLTAPQLMSHTIPVYGLKEAEYICNDLIGISATTKATTYYCYSGKEILFNRTYDSYDEESRTFTYSETVKISDQIVDDGIGYVEVSAPLQLNKTSTSTHRIYFDVPPNSKGKFDISLSFKIGSTDYISTLDPLWDTTTQSEFNNGTYYHTFYNATGGFVQMSAGEVSGAYTSQVFDASDVAQWNTAEWTQGGYYGDNLPDSAGVETGLGGAVMTGNYLLVHADNDWLDYSGNSYSGTAFGATFTTAKLGTYAGNFNGANNYVTFGNIADFERTQTFSVETWFKTSFYSATTSTMISRASLGSPYTGWHVSMTNGEIIYSLTYSSTAANWLSVKVAQNYADGAWHHLVVTYDGSSTAAGVKIYVDGVSKSLTIIADSLTSSIKYAAPLCIGARNAGGFWWNGQIDETAIFTRVLSATEDYNHYVRGAFRLTPSVRSCDDPICSGESFAGIAGPSPQNLYVSNNRYFQYRFSFTRDLPFTPTLYDVTIDYISPTVPTPPTPPTPLSLSMGLYTALFITDQYGNRVLDYATEPLLGFTIELADGTIQTVGMASNFGLATHDIIFQVVSDNPLNTTKLEVACRYQNATNITLSDYSSWPNGYAYVIIPTYDQALSTYYPDNQTNLVESSLCDLKAWGQDLIITSYINTQGAMEAIPGYTFETPNPTLAGLVGVDRYSGIRGLMNSAFIVLNLFIMITGIVFFTLLVVIPLKVVEFFASRLRKKE